MKRNVYLLGLTSLLNDLSSEGIYALLPLVLGDPGLVGLVGGLFNGMAYLIKPFSGYFSDRVGKAKPFVILGYLVSSFAKLAIAFLSGIYIALAVILDRFGKGLRDAPRDALLSFAKERGWAFAVHRALDTTGAVLGTLIAAILLLFASVEPKDAILYLALISFLAILPLLFVVEKKRKGQNHHLLSAMKEAATELDRTLLIVALTGLGLVTPALFISRAEEMLGSSGILLYALFNIIYVIAAYFLGKRSDVWGRKKVLAIGLLSMIIAFLSIWSENLIFVALAFIMYGVAFGTIVPVIFARGADRVEKRLAGTGMGILQAVFGLAILISSTLAGYLISLLGYKAFLFFLIPTLLALFLLPLF